MHYLYQRTGQNGTSIKIVTKIASKTMFMEYLLIYNRENIGLRRLADSP